MRHETRVMLRTVRACPLFTPIRNAQIGAEPFEETQPVSCGRYHHFCADGSIRRCHPCRAHGLLDHRHHGHVRQGRRHRVRARPDHPFPGCEIRQSNRPNCDCGNCCWNRPNCGCDRCSCRYRRCARYANFWNFPSHCCCWSLRYCCFHRYCHHRHCHYSRPWPARSLR